MIVGSSCRPQQARQVYFQLTRKTKEYHDCNLFKVLPFKMFHWNGHTIEYRPNLKSAKKSIRLYDRLLELNGFVQPWICRRIATGNPGLPKLPFCTPQRAEILISVLWNSLDLPVSWGQLRCFFSMYRASDISRKKSKISRDFQGQIRGKIGRFHGIFAGKQSKFVEQSADFTREKSKFTEKSADFAGF